MNADFLQLSAAILLAYAAAMWRLLRLESGASLWVVAALMGLSLLLRLVDYTNYPGGLNSDEAAILMSARKAVTTHDLFSEGPSTLPTLIPILFEAPLAPFVGFGRWAVRSYSLVCSVLSVAATFVVARAMRMRPVAALTAAALVAVLPWSIFYGRISQGGELLFHQLLLLAALARLIWRDGTWREIPGGALGLCLLFYDYFSGRSMLAMPFVGAALANGRRRLFCLAIAVIAMVGFFPQWRRGLPHGMIGLSSLSVPPALETLRLGLFSAVTAFAYPSAANSWMTVSSAAMHPWYLLALALVGLLTDVRRTLFLGAGFVLGLMPSIVSYQNAVSTHRMHSAFIFVALAASACIDLVPWRAPRRAFAAVVVAAVSYWSIAFYFSPAFWNEPANWQFNKECTDIAESIDADEAHVVATGVGMFLEMREDLQPRVRELTAKHMMLDEPGLYAFCTGFYPLLLFYEPLLASGSMQRFGAAFSVRVDGADLGLDRFGWSYRMTCGETQHSLRVPTLFQGFPAVPGFRCREAATHVWTGRWLGPATKLRLMFADSAWVETAPDGLRMYSPRASTPLIFDVKPEQQVTIRVDRVGEALAELYVVGPDQYRPPDWKWVAPVEPWRPPSSALMTELERGDFSPATCVDCDQHPPFL